MKIKKHLLLAVLLLSYLTFSGCRDPKPVAGETVKNPFGIPSQAESQILQPCRWSFTVEQQGNGEAILISTAKLDSGWHLYSQHIPGKGPATKFTYTRSEAYTLAGETEESDTIRKYDPYLEMEVICFEKEAVFRQKINVLSKKDFTLTGTIDYMVCLNQCVLSDEEFSFSVKGNP